MHEELRRSAMGCVLRWGALLALLLGARVARADGFSFDGDLPRAEHVLVVGAD